ncbi:hypothetical protein HRI_001361600 [Hibiscus trionum]|uniref:Zinc-finger domain-containing protein n=1 Tax=Hibiscus trionum TaxID=183268 RepID=A0A9W7LTH8_HIBTR|nr:hypothetical protein HRI_001361600 [Hibiscus trionum]
MAAIGNQTQAVESCPNNSDQPHNECKTLTPKISVYEQSREDRIKANLQRMQQLGLKDLSNSLLNSTSRPSSRRGRPRVATKSPVTPLSSPLPPSSALRRSSRLQNTTPVSYSEVTLSKKDELLEDLELKLSKSEVYTEEHEKLLGDTQRSWTLFVDGYGNDGKRIYDSFKGKTCHQCRQKTLGHRTHCSKCNMIQGQFCGDCLYMRYGEHVLEANENPNWVCPVCRGICNCSLCRQAKGWAPTGPFYKKITKMGYKSVAHYLIQTRRAQTNIEKSPDNTDRASAKRSLSFPAPELPSEESPEDDDNQLVTSNPQSGEDGLNSEKKEYNAYPESNALLFSKNETVFGKGEPTEINLDVHGKLGFSELDSGDKIDDGKELDFTNKEPGGRSVISENITEKGMSHDEIMGVNGEVLDGAGKNVDEGCTASESSPKRMKRPAFAMELDFTNKEPGGRSVISENITEKGMSHDEIMGVNGEVLDGVGKNVDEGCTASESSPKLMKRPASAMENGPDSNAARLKQSGEPGDDHDEQQGLPGADDSVSYDTAEKTSSWKKSKTNTKHCTSGTNMDCIARRLRPRNKAL